MRRRRRKREKKQPRVRDPRILNQLPNVYDWPICPNCLTFSRGLDGEWRYMGSLIKVIQNMNAWHYEMCPDCERGLPHELDPAMRRI